MKALEIINKIFMTLFIIAASLLVGTPVVGTIVEWALRWWGAHL